MQIFSGEEGDKAGDIPYCSKLEKSEQTVVWKMFEDIKAKKVTNQTVPKEGKLCDL